MLSEGNGLFDIEIEPNINLKILAKFPISKSSTLL